MLFALRAAEGVPCFGQRSVGWDSGKRWGVVGKEEMTKGFNSEKPVFAKLNLEPATEVYASGLRQFWARRGFR